MWAGTGAAIVAAIFGTKGAAHGYTLGGIGGFIWGFTRPFPDLGRPGIIGALTGLIAGAVGGAITGCIAVVIARIIKPTR